MITNMEVFENLDILSAAAHLRTVDALASRDKVKMLAANGEAYVLTLEMKQWGLDKKLFTQEDINNES